VLPFHIRESVFHTISILEALFPTNLSAPHKKKDLHATLGGYNSQRRQLLASEDTVCQSLFFLAPCYAKLSIALHLFPSEDRTCSNQLSPLWRGGGLQLYCCIFFFGQTLRCNCIAVYLVDLNTVRVNTRWETRNSRGQRSFNHLAKYGMFTITAAVLNRNIT
jgi:hypothetical protein